MAEDSIVRRFNNADIEQRIADGYINLNQMAKATGKRIDNWTRLQSTKLLIEEFDSQLDTPALITITSGIEGKRGGGGTWAHPNIATHFAQWCNRLTRKRNDKIVYLIKAGKYAKIGKTTLDSLDNRVSALQVGNPEELKLLAVIDGYSDVEEALHAKYSEFKVRGEWFLFQKEMLADFRINKSPS